MSFGLSIQDHVIDSKIAREDNVISASSAFFTSSIVHVATATLSKTQAAQNSLNTEVKELDPITKEWKKVEICITKGKEQNNESVHHFFIWIKTDSENPSGEITLTEKQDEEHNKAIEVGWMETFSHRKVTTKGLGRALHEFAIRFSYSRGCEGRVILTPEDDACGFHFKCGYRWPSGYTHNFYDGIYWFKKEVAEEFCNLCEQYLIGKASGLPVETLENEIKNHRYFKTTKLTATKELKREPQDIGEVLDYGLYFFWDANTLLDKFYNHPEQNLKSKYCNPVNKKFYIKGKMYLTDDARAKWKKTCLI